MRFFRYMFGRHFAAGFGAMRLEGPRPAPPPGPVVVYANHPSWWDGVAFMLLPHLLFPGRPFFMPMDAAALERYRFMKRLGVFGIPPGQRGAVTFLRTAGQVLAEPRHMLWMNAPGRFVDVRARPVPVAAGVARLPELAPGGQFIPLALEYSFWNEKAPEMLCAFGPAVPAAALLALDRAARAEHMSGLLGATADRLAGAAISRDPARFETLLRGQTGMGGVYQGWRRLRAALAGQRFDPRHEPGKSQAPRA
jgi:1-acyl-sn-glycerol-3-phosphate acyltransferase